MSRSTTLLTLALILSAAPEGTQMLGASELQAGPPEGAVREGVIRGEVIDPSGSPVRGARVYCERPGIVTKPIPALTDQNGRFEIPRLKMGTYMVFASKEDAGYADTLGSFYADPPSKITLFAQEPVANVTVRMPPQAGVLTGSVKDATSGEPIVGAQIRLTRSEASDRYIQFASRVGDGTFKTLVPADKGIDISVSSANHYTWKSHLDPVKSGSELNLDISMQSASPH